MSGNSVLASALNFASGFVALAIALWVFPASVTAQGNSGKVFASPSEALAALTAAVERRDRQALREIFGAEARELLESGDDVADRAAYQRFQERFLERHVLERKGSKAVVLYLGNEEWPFPIPLEAVKGGWQFDTREGAEEIADRRIGANELHAIKVCSIYVEAQKQYFSRDRDGDGFQEYARVVRSFPGKRNGLYWEAVEGEDLSPLGPFFADAAHEGYSIKGKPEMTPFHGYYFRILTRQGPAAAGGARNYVIYGGRMTEGFALLAYPARWNVSGVMSFQVNHEGVVYQKNLGPHTAEKAKAITAFNPDSGWAPVAE